MIFLEDTMEIAKTPQEYGKPYLLQRYSEFRDRFFEGDNGPLPSHMEISFCRATNFLGVCNVRARVTKYMFGPSHYELIDCRIELSNAYDFTTKKLDEVLIHEMVHAYFSYKGDKYIKEGHGPNFVAKCDEINMHSDYKITVKNDSPLTLNNGTANRIVNDGTVMMIGPKNDESYYICRVNEKDSGWQKQRLENWLKVWFKAFDCYDANFKNRFHTKRTQVGVASMPRETIDNMIAENIMKERDVVEQDLGKATLLAWKDAVSNDAIHYAVVTPNYEHSAWQMIYPQSTGISSYYVKTGFDGWLSKPISSGRISYQTVGKDKFREWVDSGKVVSSGSNVGASLLESVVYKKGHKNSKGEDAPWTIVSHKTSKILSSHKSKEKAEEHLRQMEYYKHVKAESSFGAWLASQSGNPVMEAAYAMYSELFG